MRLSRSAAKERTRQALLDSAERQFALKGSAARLEEIADGADLTTGAIYSGFGGKRGLVAAMFERMNDARIDVMTSATNDTMRLIDVLAVMANAWNEPDQERLIMELRTDMQVTLWCLDDPELAPALQASAASLDDCLIRHLTGRHAGGDYVTTAQDAERLVLHFRALVSQQANAVAIGDHFPDLVELSADLVRLVGPAELR